MENAVVQLAFDGSPYAAFAVKRGETLVFLMAFRRQQPLQIAKPRDFLSFADAARRVIPEFDEEKFDEETFVKVFKAGRYTLGLRHGVYQTASGLCLVQGPDVTKKRTHH
jgi:hypothetical protein